MNAVKALVGMSVAALMVFLLILIPCEALGLPFLLIMRIFVVIMQMCIVVGLGLPIITWCAK